MVWGLGKGFGCSALGRLREGVVRFEVVVWVVDSSLVDGGGGGGGGGVGCGLGIQIWLKFVGSSLW